MTVIQVGGYGAATMPVVRTHVGLLRGINVGGHNRLATSDLREIVTALGFSDVATYIQSGNVVFSCSEAESTELSTKFEQAIADRSNEVFSTDWSLGGGQDQGCSGDRTDPLWAQADVA